MKFILILLMVACSVFAQSKGLGIEVGYTSVDMSRLNNLFEDYADWIEAITGDNPSVDEFGSALFLAVFYDHPVGPSLCIGPRVEFIRLFSAEINSRDIDVVGSGHLIPLMIGGKYTFPINSTSWTLVGGAYLGVALAGASREMDIDGGPNYDVPVSGSGFICDLGLTAEHDMNGKYGLIVSLGYRFCTIDNMEVTKDVDEENIDEGDDAEDLDGDDLEFEFSGVKLGVGIKIGM